MPLDPKPSRRSGRFDLSAVFFDAGISFSTSHRWPALVTEEVAFRSTNLIASKENAMNQPPTTPCTALYDWNPAMALAPLDPLLAADLISVGVTAMLVATLLIVFRARFRPQPTSVTG